MHTPCTVTCEVSPVVLFGEMYNPAPSASTLKVSETTVRWAPMLTQARACTQRVVPKECMSPNTRCGPKSPFQHIAQKCACLLGLLFGGQGVGRAFGLYPSLYNRLTVIHSLILWQPRACRGKNRIPQNHGHFKER